MGIRPDRVPEELWTEVRNTVQEAVVKTIPKKKKCNKSEEDLQIAERREVKDKREKIRSKRQRTKGKIYPSECRVPKSGKER